MNTGRTRARRAKDDAPRTEVAARGDVALATGRAKTALVVDDDDETREYLRDLLTLSGFDVEAAADAAGARELVARQEPCVMLIDIAMPGETGASLLRDLRARNVEAPALFVTARTGEWPRILGQELNAGVVTKPFRASDFLEAVSRAIAAAERPGDETTEPPREETETPREETPPREETEGNP